jgi:hypothetical protein
MANVDSIKSAAERRGVFMTNGELAITGRKRFAQQASDL